MRIMRKGRKRKSRPPPLLMKIRRGALNFLRERESEGIVSKNSFLCFAVGKQTEPKGKYQNTERSSPHTNKQEHRRREFIYSTN